MMINRCNIYNDPPTIEAILLDYAKKNNIDITSKSLSEIIESTKQYIFDFDYPMWTDGTEYGDYRPKFETLFLKHFFKNKICFHDVDEWKLQLDGVLNLIMPYYNNLLQSETWFDKYIENPADNTNYTDKFTRKVKDKADSQNRSESKSDNDTSTKFESADGNITQGVNTADAKTKAVDSDLPKNMYDDGTDYASTLSNVGNESKTDSITTGNSETKQTGNNKSNASSESSDFGKTNRDMVEEYEFKRVGNIGVQTPGQVFATTRLAFINTTRDIFDDEIITELFFKVYDIQ